MVLSMKLCDLLYLMPSDVPIHVKRKGYIQEESGTVGEFKQHYTRLIGCHVFSISLSTISEQEAYLYGLPVSEIEITVK